MPKWILIVSALFALMELAGSLVLFLAPESFLEMVDFTAKGVDYLVYMWATRQFALGFILAFATMKRSVPMLTIAYVFLLVMFVGDLIIGFTQKDSALIISSLVMCILSATMLFALYTRR